MRSDCSDSSVKNTNKYKKVSGPAYSALARCIIVEGNENKTAVDITREGTTAIKDIGNTSEWQPHSPPSKANKLAEKWWKGPEAN